MSQTNDSGEAAVTIKLTNTSDQARARMVEGLRAFADALEQGAVMVSGHSMFRPMDDGSVMLTSDLCLAHRVDQKFTAWTNPANLPADVRQKMIHIRDAHVAGDLNEAVHWLYAIACPSFTCLDPYAAIEGRMCTCGPHPLGPPV